MEQLRTWLTLGDYDDAKRDVSHRIVRKQTRRNVSAQSPDGAITSRAMLLAKSRAADADMRHLKDLVEAAQ